MIAISVCGTKSYLYAFKSCIRRIIAAGKDVNEEIVFIYVSDKSEDCSKAYDFIKSEIPEKWGSHHITVDVEEKGEKYKKDRQLLIASIQGEGFAYARKLNADWLWNVEPDVLVPIDSLQVLRWALQMPTEGPGYYYDVAMVTYFNGQFLGGHGSYQNQIAEDFLPKERKLTPEIEKALKLQEKEEEGFKKDKKQPSKEWIEKAQKLREEIKKCPPNGNIWELNAKGGWRPRGWLDQAYPAIGRGAILPSNWCGLGCTYISKKALNLSNFDSYEGSGTQDLFLNWNKWAPSDIKITVIPHTLCDHIKPEKIDDKETGKYINYHAYHEQMGDAKGHLRVRQIPWIEI